MLDYLKKFFTKPLLTLFSETGTSNTLLENTKNENNISSHLKKDVLTQDQSLTDLLTTIKLDNKIITDIKMVEQTEDHSSKNSLATIKDEQNTQTFDKPLIGIMTATKKKRIKSLQAYQNYQTIDGTLFAFTAKDIDWKRKKINGIYQVDGQWKERLFPFPESVYNRSYSRRKKTIRRLEKVIGKNRCFNHISRFNKWSVHQGLASCSISEYIPDTCIFTKRNLRKMLRKHKVVFLKPCYGYKAKRIYRLELADDGTKKIYEQSYHPKFQFADYKSFLRKIEQLTEGKKFLLQKEISLYKVDGHCFDIRAMVQKNTQGEWEVTACASRIAPKHSFITNYAYAIYSAEKILKEVYPNEEHHYEIINMIETLEKVGVQAAKSLERKYGHLGEISVDFGIDKDKKIWIIEANGQPQKYLFKLLGNSKPKTLVYQTPLKYAYYLAKES